MQNKSKIAVIVVAVILWGLTVSSSIAQGDRGINENRETKNPSTPARSGGPATADATAAAVGKVQIALLTLPEVLPPWRQLDYDVRLEFFHGGANNLCYCVRHLENLCRNFGLPVRRTDIAGLESLGNAVLLVPDASQMLPATRQALDKWIAQDKPVIVFGEVPKDWALQHGVEVGKAANNSRAYDTVRFPADGLAISGTPLRYVSYVAKYPVALLTSSRDVGNRATVACRQGSLLFWGWSPRPHAWAVVGEQEDHRLFARLLRELHVDVDVPVISSDRIRNLKSLGVDDWGLWRGWPPYEKYFEDIMPSLADYGFDHVYLYGSCFGNIIVNKLAADLLGTPTASSGKRDGAGGELEYLRAMVKKAHASRLKLFVVINPFAVPNRRLEAELLKRDGLMFRNTDGVLQPTRFWSPADPKLKRLAVQSVKEFLAHERVDGIFIDFARYLDGNFDYGPAMKRAFEERVGTRLADWPGAVVNDAQLARRYAAFKRQVMNDFLGAFGLAAKEAQKDVVVEALFYWDFWPDRGGAYEAIGQDPKTLLKIGAIDRACGIFYTSDNAQLARLVDTAIDDVGRDAFSCIISPMSFFNEYSTTRQIFDQIQILKDKGVKHASIFDHATPSLFYNRFQDGERLPTKGGKN